MTVLGLTMTPLRSGKARQATQASTAALLPYPYRPAFESFQ